MPQQQSQPRLCDLLLRWFLILLLSPSACQDDWLFVCHKQSTGSGKTLSISALRGWECCGHGVEVTKCCAWLSYWDSVNRFRPALSVVCLCVRWKESGIERLKAYFSPPHSSISDSIQCWAQISRWFTIEPLLCLLTAVILQGTVQAALPKYHV